MPLYEAVQIAMTVIFVSIWAFVGQILIRSSSDR